MVTQQRLHVSANNISRKEDSVNSVERIISSAIFFCFLFCFCNGAIAKSIVDPPEVNYESTTALLGVKVSPLANSGAAGVGIPIDVPPGRAGLAPNLQLSYNSNGRNGWVGVGWDLELGAIQRNTKRGVNYSSNDYIALNGTTQELVSRSDWGSSYYGARVESEFSKYYFNSSTSGWVATAKDGTTYYYGSTTASRLNGSGGIFRWHLDKIADKNGNYIEISYTADSGTLYPAAITYTKNSSFTPATTSKITFELEARSDVITSLVSGTEQRIIKRLKSISVYGAHPALSRKYLLNYTASSTTSRSMLNTVTLYGSDGVTTLPAFKFSQQTGPTTVSERWSQARAAGYSSQNESFQTADVNGDGRADFVYDSNGTIRVKLSQGNSFNEVVWGSRAAGYAAEMPVFQLGDVNGDGMADFVYDAGGTIRVLLGRADLGAAQASDVAWGTRSGSYYNFSMVVLDRTSQYYPSFQLGDVDGDGKADFIYNSSANSGLDINVLFSSGTGFGASQKWGVRKAYNLTYNSPIFLVGGSEKHVLSLFRIADVNGDGKADFVHEASTGNEIVVLLGATVDRLPQNTVVWGTHNGHFSKSAWTAGWQAVKTRAGNGERLTYQGYQLADVNGDGIADFVYQATNGLSVMLGSPQGFQGSQLWNSTVLSAKENQYGDPNYFCYYTWYQYPGLPAPVRVSACAVNGQIWPSTPPFLYLLPFQLADVNGDGLADIVYNTTDNSMRVLLSTGVSFQNQYTWGTRSTDYYSGVKNFALADINGNGMADLVYDGNGTIRVMDATGGQNATYPDLLSGIVNGMGGTYALSYASSVNYNNAVTVGGQAKYLPFVLNTLTSVTQDYGAGIIYGGSGYASQAAGASVTNFAYSGGYYDAESREFRGFNTVTATNPDSSVATSVYHQDDYCKGREQSTELRTPGQAQLSSTAFTWKTALGGATEYACGALTDASGWGFVRLNQKSQTTDGVTTNDSFAYSAANGFVQSQTTSGTGAETITKSYTYADKGNWTWRQASETVTGATSGTARQTTSTHDASGNLLTTTSVNSSGASPVVTLGNYQYGNPTSQTSANGFTTTTAYDAATRTFPVTVTHPTPQGSGVAQVERYEYDARFGKVAKITNVNNQSTIYHYDVLGRPDRINYPDGGKTEIEFCDTRLPRIMRVMEYSSSSSFVPRTEFHDGLGRLIQTTAIGGNNQFVISKTLHDVMGREKYTIGPAFYPFVATEGYFATSLPAANGNYPRTVTAFDYLGRPTSATKYATINNAETPVTTSYSYGGGAVITTDPDGNRRRMEKDHLGRLTRVTESYDRAAVHDTTYQYNAAGDLLGIYDQGGQPISRYVYNTLGRKVQMIDVNLGTWNYAYDLNGNLIDQTDANGQTIHFTYDSLNRVVKKSYVGQDPATAVNYTYDLAAGGVGQKTAIISSASTHTFAAYDAMGRVREESRTIGASADIYTTRYGYDYLGRLTSVDYPDNYRLTFAYYPSTKLLRVVVAGNGSTLATYGGYDPFGRETNTALTNGVATEKLYDPRSGRITGIRSFNASKDLQNKAFAYYTSGDVKSITNTVAGLRYDYSYDALHRLTHEMQISLANPLDAKETTYTYQYNGNILAKSEDNGAVSLAYQYNDPAHAHAVSAVVSGGQTFAYAYDANGNLTSGRDFTDAVAVASRAITYNPDGLPSRIVHNTGSSPLTTDFAYDGDGFRVKKTAGNRFTLYAGDYFEKSENGASKFLFANGSRIAKIDNSGAYYFHQDHLGSTTVVSNATGNAVTGESAEYKPFGGFRVALDSTVSNYRFTDQEFDPESNLYYYDARYYDPVIGRFVSADTVIPDYKDPQSLNRYSYVKNNPLMYVDPTGHVSFSFDLNGKSWGWDSERVDWGGVKNAAQDIGINVLGAGYGGLLMLNPSAPGFSQVAGGYVVFKSAYGGTSGLVNLWSALNGKESDSSYNTLHRTVASSVAREFAPSRMEEAMMIADWSDILGDALSARMSFRFAYGKPTLQGAKGFIQSYDPYANLFTKPTKLAVDFYTHGKAATQAVETSIDVHKKYNK